MKEVQEKLEKTEKALAEAKKGDEAEKEKEKEKMEKEMKEKESAM